MEERFLMSYDYNKVSVESNKACSLTFSDCRRDSDTLTVDCVVSPKASLTSGVDAEKRHGSAAAVTCNACMFVWSWTG